ncbi:MAG: methyltransferase domain-containing protein [Chitinivibrionales bacterium]|nr:methyltransferase domain-containing protein [Chitinivibrionales bacterium]
MSSWLLAVTCTTQECDTVTALLCTFFPAGLEDNPNGINAFFSSPQDARLALENLHQRAPSLRARIKEIAERDWNAAWRTSIEPVEIAVNFWVSPEWKPPALRGGEHWIKIEPKMTFGTGHHATTRLACRALQDVAAKYTRPRVLDIGAGTGILCFLADKAGAGCCVGIEIDPCACENLAENRRLNEIGGRIDLIVAAPDALRSQKCFDIIVMNIIRSRSEPLLSHVKRLLCRDGTFIWTGQLCEERDEIIDAASAFGFILIKSSTHEDWWCGEFDTWSGK